MVPHPLQRAMQEIQRMTNAVHAARAANLETPRRRAGLLLLCAAAWLAACGDDGGPAEVPGVDPGTNPAGSCNFMAEARCAEYAENDANSSTAGSCTAAGGTWMGN